MAVTASGLLDDIQKQADVTAYLLELLDDREIRAVAWQRGNVRDCVIDGIDRYRDLLKQRLREGK